MIGSARFNLRLRSARTALVGLMALLLLLAAQGLAVGALATSQDDERTAALLADMLSAVRSVVAKHQDRINDPEIGDKGLTGDVILDEATASFREATGIDPAALEPGSRDARLMAALQDSIREIVAEHQETINAEGLGFKGFIPAVVGRLVSQRFNEKVGDEALMRVTAPPELVRNRTARPDAWESSAIHWTLKSPDWPTGQTFSELTAVDGREAFRILVPEYYGAGCLSCHGEPAGEIDMTGYPKEGGKLGQLGGVISITLFR